MKKAILYPRVSSKKQELEGGGLVSQETSMRRYCNAKGYQVVKVFSDTHSGGGDFWDRPAMRSLLSYLDDNKKSKFVVIFDDLKRLARDVFFHWQLRKEFETRGVEIECLNYKFDDSPEGKFLETILSAQGQLEREQNKRQVVQKMQTWLDKGYYLGCTPLGYRSPTKEERQKYEKAQKLPDHKLPLIKEAFELYDTGNYSLSTLTDEMKKRGLKGKSGKPITKGTIETILKNPFYVGLFRWNGEIYKGNHEPAVDRPLFDRVQERLTGKNVRGKSKHEYSLSKFVQCSCGWNLIPSQHKKHIYLECHNPKCKAYYKIKKKKVRSIREDIVFDLIIKVVRELKISNRFSDIIRSELKTLKTKTQYKNEKFLETCQNDLKKLEKKMQRIELGFDEGIYSAEKFKTKEKEIEDEKEAIYERMKKTDLALNRGYYDTAFKSILIGKVLSDKFLSLSPETKRECLELFFDSVVIEDGELQFNLSDVGIFLRNYKMQNDNLELSQNQSQTQKTGLLDPVVQYGGAYRTHLELLLDLGNLIRSKNLQGCINTLFNTLWGENELSIQD